MKGTTAVVLAAIAVALCGASWAGDIEGKVTA